MGKNWENSLHLVLLFCRYRVENTRGQLIKECIVTHIIGITKDYTYDIGTRILYTNRWGN